MTVVEKLLKELSAVIDDTSFSINYEEDNSTIKYIYLNGKFHSDDLLHISEIFKRYKGRNAYGVLSNG